MTALNPDIERPMILLFCISFLRIFLVKIYSVNDYDIIRPDPCLGPTITAHSHSFESDFKDDHLFYFQRPFNWLGTFKARHFSFYHILPSGRFRNVCSTWLTLPTPFNNAMPHDSNESAKLFFHTTFGANRVTISQTGDKPSWGPKIPILRF